MPTPIESFLQAYNVTRSRALQDREAEQAERAEAEARRTRAWNMRQAIEQAEERHRQRRQGNLATMIEAETQRASLGPEAPPAGAGDFGELPAWASPEEARAIARRQAGLAQEDRRRKIEKENQEREIERKREERLATTAAALDALRKRPKTYAPARPKQRDILDFQDQARQLLAERAKYTGEQFSTEDVFALAEKLQGKYNGAAPPPAAPPPAAPPPAEPPPPAAAPKVGDRKAFRNGRVGEWDGKGWALVE